MGNTVTFYALVRIIVISALNSFLKDFKTLLFFVVPPTKIRKNKKKDVTLRSFFL